MAAIAILALSVRNSVDVLRGSELEFTVSGGSTKKACREASSACRKVFFDAHPARQLIPIRSAAANLYTPSTMRMSRFAALLNAFSAAL